MSHETETTTTSKLLKREVLPSVVLVSTEPWSGIDQESAFAILADHLEHGVPW